jgi:hypothetical protein
MAWMTKGSRAYEIQSVRRSGRVTSTYIGGGIPAEAAEFLRRLADGRRAQREAERAEWEAERSQLAEVERQFIEVDEAYDELAEAALYATGHHRPQRGRWRRRRQMATDIQKTQADRPLVSESEMAGLLDLIEGSEGDEKQQVREHVQEQIRLLVAGAKVGDERTLPALRVLLSRRPDHLGKLGIADFTVKAAAIAAGGAQDVLIRDLFVKEIEATAAQLAGPDASTLERLLCQRVALAHFDALHRDIAAIEAEANNCSRERAEFLTRLRDRATARFLAACRSLAVVRKLALPTLQLHLNAPAANVPEFAVGPAEISAPRLRLRGQS